jgi:hypothetical protein
MPDKPAWYSRLDEVIDELEALPSPWVDSASLEFVLRVGRRRAQQILRPLVRDTIGKSGLAKRDEVVDHLRSVAAGNAAYYEMRRRKRLRFILDQVRQAATQPQVLVEAPASIVRQEFAGLDNQAPATVDTADPFMRDDGKAGFVKHRSKSPLLPGSCLAVGRSWGNCLLRKE